MAELIGGIGTPHSPMVGIEPSGWRQHGELEQERLRALDSIAPTTRSSDELELELVDEVMVERHGRLQAGLARMTQELESMAPDVLVIVGDDQRELFLEDALPAIAVYWGDELWDLPPGADAFPPSMRSAYRWWHADGPEPYPTHAGLGRHIVEHLAAADFDVAQFREQSEGRTLGHAFTFVYRRLLGGRRVPLVPVFLNTYYPPNQPRPARCFALGRALRSAVEAWEGDERVVVVASGGLSHPIIDEDLDRSLLKALVDHDVPALESFLPVVLQEGSSEIRNWITVAGVCEDADVEILDYVPAYRSMAGSGCGMAFAVWRRR